LSVGIVQSLTAPEFAKIEYADGHKETSAVEPAANYTITRVQKDYNQGTTTFGGMFTSVNRFIQDSQLDFLSKNAYTGGLDLLHQWNNKKYFVDAKVLGSYLSGSVTAMRQLQESSARYYQRPGADYLNYDTTRTSLGGYGGRVKIGKGSGLWRYNTGVRWLSPGLELNDLGYMQMADEISQENNISYFVVQPVSIFRSYSANLEQFNTWNFNGDYIGSGAHLSFSGDFTNKWGIAVNAIGETRRLDTRQLRGGPNMLMPAQFLTFGSINTDRSKRLSFSVEYQYQLLADKAGFNYSLSPGLSARPWNALVIGISANYTKNLDETQYVDTRSYNGSERYILGRIDQTTLGLTFRIDYSLTPNLSVQYYGSPFISTGKYKDFKNVIDPMNENYDKRFVLYPEPEIIGDGTLGLDDNNDGISDYTINNPDFNFQQFRSNLVAKWKVFPGSYLYFVWSSEKTVNGANADATIGESYKELRNQFPHNIFLIKFNYWFAL